MGVGNDSEVATAIIEVVFDVMGLVRTSTISGGGGGGVLTWAIHAVHLQNHVH
jgi:hypothetical protein